MSKEGDTAVSWLASQKLSEYNIIHIQGVIGSEAQIGRSGALDDKVNAESSWNIVTQQTAEWNAETAQQIVQSVIDSGKKFNVIYAENDDMAKGAVAALDKANISHGVGKDVIVMGFDCNKWALEELLKGNWNYDGQCNPFQASYIHGVQLVSKMMGKELDDFADIDRSEIADTVDRNSSPVFEAVNLSSAAGVNPFDFTIRKGEVNGFTGLLGSGRSESVRAIYGADRVTGGTIKMDGKEVRIKKPLDAMKLGISYLPEDRKRDGIIGDLSVKDNIILALQVMKGVFHPISKSDAEKFADDYIKLLGIKTASRDTPIKSLSGGNQQKAILARWLLANPVYLILDEPTRGIDVGTKLEIQKLVLKLAGEGKSVTFISSEIDEMLHVCSRLIVMRDMHVVGELTGDELTQTKIMSTIAGGEKR